MSTKDFTKYSNKKLKRFLWEWESLPSTRILNDINTYIKARQEAFKRWDDNSYYYIIFFNCRPNATLKDFKVWLREKR
ncbi:MAG: hypothetical protein ACOCUI_03375 [bacterium]